MMPGDHHSAHRICVARAIRDQPPLFTARCSVDRAICPFFPVLAAGDSDRCGSWIGPSISRDSVTDYVLPFVTQPCRKQGSLLSAMIHCLHEPRSVLAVEPTSAGAGCSSIHRHRLRCADRAADGRLCAARRGAIRSQYGPLRLWALAAFVWERCVRPPLSCDRGPALIWDWAAGRNSCRRHSLIKSLNNPSYIRRRCVARPRAAVSPAFWSSSLLRPLIQHMPPTTPSPPTWQLLRLGCGLTIAGLLGAGVLAETCVSRCRRAFFSLRHWWCGALCAFVRWLSLRRKPRM